MLYGSRVRQCELCGSGVLMFDFYVVFVCVCDCVEGVFVGEVVVCVDWLVVSEWWLLQQFVYGLFFVYVGWFDFYYQVVGLQFVVWYCFGECGCGIVYDGEVFW